MKNGDSRRARPSCTWIDASKMVCSPPMPEPIITPVAQRSSSPSGIQPESSTASVAATRPRWMKRSIFLTSFTGIHSAISRPCSAFTPDGTWPATLQGRSLVSNAWIAPMPDSLLISRCHTCSTPSPRGQAIPMPVTTTRRIAMDPPPMGRSGSLLLLDILDRILYRADLLSGVLGDLHAERLLEGHHQFDGVQAVGAQVIDERGLGRDLGFLDSEMLDHNFSDLVRDLAHRLCNSS